MPFTMMRDIPETYEELKQAFIAECKERYENNERARRLLTEAVFKVDEYKDLYYQHCDDWVWCYGSKYDQEDQEWIYNIAGGGDHWENWIVGKEKCYIENKKGREEVHTFGVSPDGHRMKIWEKDDIDDALDGEMDIRDLIVDDE
jgi:hypothetical protein